MEDLLDLKDSPGVGIQLPRNESSQTHETRFCGGWHPTHPGSASNHELLLYTPTNTSLCHPPAATLPATNQHTHPTPNHQLLHYHTVLSRRRCTQEHTRPINPPPTCNLLCTFDQFLARRTLSLEMMKFPSGLKTTFRTSSPMMIAWLFFAARTRDPASGKILLLLYSRYRS